jgi:hypothetical protein
MNLNIILIVFIKILFIFRLSAIEAIMTLLQVHKEAETQGPDLRNKIAYVIMLYLPGIASGLLEVAVSSDIQNHKIPMVLYNSIIIKY